MSHRRAKRLRAMFAHHKPSRAIMRTIRRMTKGQKLPTLKELHNADVHADLPDSQ